MKKEVLKIELLRYSSEEELPEISRNLIERAKAAAKDAWAPYSGFKVGAALLMSNGEVITGNNQENGAFPSGLCAERVALFYAGSRYPGMVVEKIALTAFSDGDFLEKPVYPCGSCRQVMAGHEERVASPMEVIMYGRSEIIVLDSSMDLLPLPFHLKK